MDLPYHTKVYDDAVVLVQSIQIQVSLVSYKPQFHHLMNSKDVDLSM